MLTFYGHSSASARTMFSLPSGPGGIRAGCGLENTSRHKRINRSRRIRRVGSWEGSAAGSAALKTLKGMRDPEIYGVLYIWMTSILGSRKPESERMVTEAVDIIVRHILFHMEHVCA